MAERRADRWIRGVIWVCSTSVCRLASGSVLPALFLLTWASLAVGLFEA